MKTRIKALTLGLAGSLLVSLSLGFKSSNKNPMYHNHIKICGTKGCTFKTIFGEESSEGHSHFKDVEKVNHSVNTGLSFLASAQQENGG